MAITGNFRRIKLTKRVMRQNRMKFLAEKKESPLKNTTNALSPLNKDIVVKQKK